MREALKVGQSSSGQGARSIISKARRSAPKGVGRFCVSVRLSYERNPRKKRFVSDSLCRTVCVGAWGIAVVVVVLWRIVLAVAFDLASHRQYSYLVGISPHQQPYDYRTALPERFQMYLSATDLLAVMIALVVSVTLVITSAVANARLTRSVQEYREAWLTAKQASFIVLERDRVEEELKDEAYGRIDAWREQLIREREGK